MTLALQALLALAYTVLAHLSSARDSAGLGAAALVVLALMLVLAPLLRLRWWAWLALALQLAGVAALYRAGLVRAPMLLVPVAFVALIAWWFARSLRAGRVPLITRIVSALDHVAPEAMAADLQRYTRGLTATWAWLLAGLAVVNLALAVLAVPDGLLATLGLASPLPVTRTQWSWFANICNYGVIGGFFIVEYQFRKRRFPGRYDSFLHFLRKLAALGPGFWRDFLRP
ncbi:ketosynthase [Luteimonas lutimaris]|nr:ketosynthase [Luteimonas sp.]